MCQRNIGKTNRDHSFDIKYNTKVEKILKGSRDLIQSPSLSVKIQIMGGKVCLNCKGKLMFVFKSLITLSKPYRQ